MITLTEVAANKLRELAEAADLNITDGESGSAVFITVHAGGCSGFQYGMGFFPAPVPTRDHALFHSEGVCIAVPKAAVPLLGGTVVDWHEDLMNSGFTFRNPNAEHTCGCGKSFS